MLKAGKTFRTATVDEWLDCGTLPAWLETSGIIVEKEGTGYDEADYKETKIIPPVYIGDDVELDHCTIGPHASIASGSTLKNCTVKNSLIQEYAQLEDCNIENSTIGKHTELKGVDQEVHLGDHSKIGV